MFHFTIVVSLSMKQKSRKKHWQFDGTLAMIILKNDMRYIYHFAGIFSLFSFYNNIFCGNGIFCKQIANFSARKTFFHLGALQRRKYWSYMKNALNKKCAECYYLQLLFKHFFL